VVDDLGLSIIRGDIAPGSSIPHEEELRATFGVSRTVTREAIRSLAAKGLVNSKPKIGTVVCPQESWNYLDSQVLDWSVRSDQTGHFFIQLAQLRKAIEPEAAATVAQYGSEDEIADIAKKAETMQACTSDFDAHLEADLAFHLSILRAAKNPLFGPITQVIVSSLEYTLKMTHRNEEDNKLSAPLHVAIANAIVSRHSDLARMAMISHFDDLTDRLKSLFKDKTSSTS
jgi:DNA-binding FadR family transcriptional regulator